MHHKIVPKSISNCQFNSCATCSGRMLFCVYIKICHPYKTPTQNMKGREDNTDDRKGQGQHKRHEQDKLYDTHVIPIIDYCSGVWSVKMYENCEKLQNKAIRFFLGVHRFTSNVVIHGDTAWLNPHIRRKLNMLKLLNRILSLNDDRLTKLFYCMILTIIKRAGHMR